MRECICSLPFYNFNDTKIPTNILKEHMHQNGRQENQSDVYNISRSNLLISIVNNKEVTHGKRWEILIPTLLVCVATEGCH